MSNPSHLRDAIGAGQSDFSAAYDANYLDIRIPETWPAKPNQNWQIAHQATRTLLINLKLLSTNQATLRSFDDSQFSLLSGYAYQNAEVERFKLCNDWHTWLFFFDDQIDTDCGLGQNPALVRRHMESLLQTLRTGRVSARATPLELFTANIRERMVACASDAWFQRFQDDVEDYLLKGTLQTAVHWRRGTPPDLNSYVEQRIYDSAVLTCQDLSEITEPELELPAAVLSDKIMRELRLLSARVVAFTNDVFSYVKEVLLHNNPNNLVHVIMTQRQCSRREAIAQSIHIINRDVDKFGERELLLPAWDAETSIRVRRYMDGLKAWMRGNYLWSLESGRYLEPIAQQAKTWSGTY